MPHRTSAQPAVDALVHPVCLDRSLRQHLPAPWRRYSLTKPEHYVYPPPFGEYRAGLAMTAVDEALGGDSRGVAVAARGITPEQVRDELFGPDGVGTAVLLPLARGLQSDPDLDAVIASGINEWLAETWLADANADGRFKGSIRVSAQHPAQAVAEIRKWSGHPHMVQVAVPLQAKSPYGERSYWPIWEAAAEHGYPIAVHADTGDGIEAAPTAMGFPLSTYAMHVLQPLNGLIHLASLVAQGVFARYGSLKWVFGDGAFHAYAPVFWRFNNEWRASRFQTPWVDRRPSDFLSRHVRVILRSCDASSDRARLASFLRLAGGEETVMYGSGFPYWDAWTLSEASGRLPEEFAGAVLGESARSLYGLE